MKKGIFRFLKRRWFLPRRIGITWQEVRETLLAQIEAQLAMRRSLIAYLEDKGEVQYGLVSRVPEPKTEDDVTKLPTGFVIKLTLGEWEDVKSRILNST